MDNSMLKNLKRGGCIELSLLPPEAAIRGGFRGGPFLAKKLITYKGNH